MKNGKQLRKMVTTAILLALILLFGLTKIGMWNFGVVYITLLCVPVIIGTMTLGLGGGLVLALCFGTVSLVTAIEQPSALVSPVLSANILWVIVLCYVPRLLVPLTTYAVYRMVRRSKSKALIAIPAAVGSLTNTFLYLGFILIMYALIGIDNPALLGTLGGIVLAGGLPEAAFSALVCPPVIIALGKAGLIAADHQ